MSARASAAVVLAKAASLASRAFGVGGGTTVPGRVARAVDPRIIPRLAARLPMGSVVVSGTNGKTTTARLLSRICAEAGWLVTHNRAGANLHAGIAAALVAGSSWTGRPLGDVGLFEVDEFTLPRLARDLRPRVVVLTNLFRDQLDRYGEIDLIASRWHGALSALDAGTTLLYNADDPQVAAIARDLPLKVVPFGVEDETCGRASLEDAADARYCYRCGTPYVYRVVYLSHAGKYACPNCGLARPHPSVSAESVALDGIDGAAAVLAWDGGARISVRTALPGLYNVYNLLAAGAAAAELGASAEAIAAGIAAFVPAFGRAERLAWNGVQIRILLGKNPAGFNELLRAVEAKPPAALLVAINDRTADGTDVSWLWDVDFEALRALAAPITVAGTRAHDMALRLKYAGLPEARVRVAPELPGALRAAAADAGGGTLVALPTYTAMLELRETLRALGVARGFWED